MTKLRRSIVAPIAAAALLSTVAACGSDSSTDASSSSTAGSSGPPSGFPGGGGPGGGLQTFTAVDLDTDGENGSDANTTDVVTAATAFLATLDSDTAAKVSYDFTDNESRQTWSNFPAQQVPRKGVALSDLDDDAKAAAMALVKTMLSAEGYAQVQAIQEADDWLHENSASGTDSFGSDTDYYIAIYGTPSASDSFMVQFGGHHLARNYTYKGTTASITPDFTGTEPKSFTIGSTDVEPMKEKAGTLFDVFDSLSEEQESQAELSDTIDDILMGPGVDSGEFPETQGVAVSDLSTDQQQLVLDAIGAWVDDAAPGVAASLMETYKSQLDQTYVAFANSDTIDGESTYLRIDGPRVWIELVNTRSQSTPNVHYHGVYRDKNDDYGSTNPSA
ncbi:conserved exported hypothetical protein [Parafrankia sp. Ea1.12]|uniref:DUF3500 domain-containing protein n=1 Tax=Parafrankia sp. Ea1.12 TaxID=573499 RepID=UPI000DA4ECDE|nr:DUF3500 domain-containing protein [Parafrankia sp. Ea1.12]SQD93967.1 conserved exported hypothetical protein [Parafrankia sp. Ea1.12]